MKRKIIYIAVIGLLLLNGAASFSVAATNPDNNDEEQKQLQIKVFVFGRFLYPGNPGKVDPDSHIIELPEGCFYWIRITSNGKPISGAKVTLIQRYDDGTTAGRHYRDCVTLPFGFVRSFFMAPTDNHMIENTKFILTALKEGYTGSTYILNFY